MNSWRLGEICSSQSTFSHCCTSQMKNHDSSRPEGQSTTWRARSPLHCADRWQELQLFVHLCCTPSSRRRRRQEWPAPAAVGSMRRGLRLRIRPHHVQATRSAEGPVVTVCKAFENSPSEDEEITSPLRNGLCVAYLDGLPASSATATICPLLIRLRANTRDEQYGKRRSFD